MSFLPIEIPVTGNTQTSSALSVSGRDDQAARQAAVQFEAVLLNQLTAALNPASDVTGGDDEDSLFSSTGSEMYRQMFSEQMAKVMAENGGIGLAETIMRQLRARSAAQPAGIDRAIAAARSVRSGTSGSASVRSALVILPVAPSAPVAIHSPLDGRITSTFGSRRDPINGHHRVHQGVDIAAPQGTPIGAAAAGTVVFAGRRGGYGKTVMIEQADGRQTRYAHADHLLVKAGDQVVAGQVIATVGSTGHSTGPHLHFEIRENGQPVNPLTTITKDFMLARR